MNRQLSVGLFVFASLGLFATGLVMIGNRHQAFVRHTEFYTEFADLSGIAKGAKVQVAGMDAGQVLDVGIPDSPSSKFRVRFQIDEKLHGLVRADSVVTIGTEGVVGNKFLSVSPGNPRLPVAHARMTLANKEPTDLSALIGLAKGTITDVDNTFRNANGLVTNVNGVVTRVAGNLSSTLGGASTAIANANDVITRLKQGNGTAGLLLSDEALAEQVRQAVANAEKATSELRQASTNVNTLTSDIQSRGFPRKIDDTLASASDALSNFDATSRQIRQVVADASGPDEKGVPAAINLRESLSHINTATGNIADDTEALKHNFLLRGFFGRRGYYNLTQISASQYRKDRFFASSRNHRIWLGADQLFVRNSSGLEELAPKGKSLLDAALSRNGGALLDSPMVVEGYSSDGMAVDCIANSRDRSALVRNYIQSRFQVDPNNIGSVSLEKWPPKGIDHSTWDGISIVVLTSKQ